MLNLQPLTACKKLNLWLQPRWSKLPLGLLQDSTGYDGCDGQEGGVGTWASGIKYSNGIEKVSRTTWKNNAACLKSICANCFYSWGSVVFMICFVVNSGGVEVYLYSCCCMSLNHVYRQSSWMRAFGAKTPKRTSLWSNWKEGGEIPKLADIFYDRFGRKRYKGNRNLRKSQCHSHLVFIGFMILFCSLWEECIKKKMIYFFRFRSSHDISVVATSVHFKLR